MDIPKQGKYWYKYLSEFLATLGLVQSEREPCLFYSSAKEMMVIFYVDDFAISAVTTAIIDNFFGELMKKFQVRRLGEPKEFLGIQIVYDRHMRSIIIHQHNYIKKLSAKFGIIPGRGKLTPMAVKFDNMSELVEVQPFEYSTLVGALLFLSVCTRLDVSFPSGFLARQTQSPKPGHFHAALRVLGYLDSTSTWGVHLSGIGENPTLDIFSDSDWAGDVETRRSTAGILILYNNSVVDWKSQAIKTISLSSTEAELNSLAAAVQRTQYIMPIFKELGHMDIGSRTSFYEDNQPAIHMVKNGGMNGKRAKHMDVKVKYCIEELAHSHYGIYAVRSSDQLADFLTKALPAPAFRAVRGLLMCNVSDGGEECVSRIRKLQDILSARSEDVAFLN
jgi:hypothetical protein